MRSLLFAWIFCIGSVASKPEASDKTEARIIVRYPKSSRDLDASVKQLAQIPGVRKAEPLPSLDMAVIVCESHDHEEKVMQALQSHSGIELAVPDTWVELDGMQVSCSKNPKCQALGLQGACCPAADGLRLGCCEDPPGPVLQEEHGFSTVSLQSWHGGFLAVHWGNVGFLPDSKDPGTHFFVVAHADGYVSLKTWYGAYLVATPPGRLAAWHRGHAEPDDFEKFKLVYHKDKSVSLRSKANDKYVAAEDPRWGVLTADREEIDSWEKFNVTVTHGWDTVIPDDAAFENLWGIDHYGDRDIDAPEAWKFFPEPPTNNVIVAVIDTGIDYTHPDLKDQMWVNPKEIPDNGIDDDGNGIIDDVHGADFANNDGDPFDDQMHGTHCAGTIAGRGNDGVGVAGVAWSGVKLMALKFLSASGGGRTSDAIKCLNYAVAMGAKISSNSWGGGGSSSAMRVAIERAESAGVLFIAAAGNEGSDNDEIPHYPSNYPSGNIVSIASTTVTGALSSFSCYGASTVDVAAPGSSIYSTIPGGKYAFLSGTSMATPHVSGLAALVWLFRPQLSMSQVREIIMESATKQDALQNSSITNGRVNARRALVLASMYPAMVPPVNKPRGLTFEDTDGTVGMIGGDAVVTAALDESDIEYYALHVYSVAGFLMDEVGRVSATGESKLTITLVNLTIPKYARGLAVVSANASAHAGPSTAAVVDIEDYGVPEFGPGAVSWGGDSDGRKGIVTGSVLFHRAKSEDSITHYNLYWQDKEGSFLGKVAASGFKKPSCEGDCHLLNTSVGETYRFHRDPYDNNEYAVISFSGPATVHITEFKTEKYYDYLEVGGRQLSGTRLHLPMTVKLEAGPQSIAWSADRSEVEAGWSFELTQTGTMAQLHVSEVAPLASEVKVVAAYTKTEGSESSVGEVMDFDAKVMPPSPALKARKLRFLDANTEQYWVEGRIEFLPASVVDAVTFYHVFLADASGTADGDGWTLDAPESADVMLHVDIPKTKLLHPVDIVVVSGNANGDGAKVSTPLLDVVRSPPLNASFSGDTDPMAGQVKGDVYVIPAKVSAGITSYSIYLANGTAKDELLGRLNAAETASAFSFHVRVEPYHQALIVVSTYGDVEMEEGVMIPLEDWEDLGEFYEADSSRGRSLSEEQPVESWLHRQQPLAWNEVQLLWTEGQDISRTKSGSALHKVMGSITIPGLQLGSRDSGSHVLPPSLEIRKALVASLAEALQMEATHLKLNKGQMLSCQAAQRLKRSRPERGSEREGADSAQCLMVAFEVSGRSQDALDQVEAQLIALNQGLTSKLNAALTRHLRAAGAHRPEGFRAQVAEPQQVAPRKVAGRKLAMSPAQRLEVLVDEDGEQGYAMVAVSIGALLGAISAAGCAAARLMKMRKESYPSVGIVQPDSSPDDVSLHLDESH